MTSSWQSENVKADGKHTLQITKPRNPEPLPNSKIRLQNTAHAEVDTHFYIKELLDKYMNSLVSRKLLNI